VADAFSKHTVRTYALHHLLMATKLPLDELSAVHMVLMDVPSKASGGFEHLLLRLVQKIRALGPHVAIMVIPSAKQQAHTMMWVARWNRFEHAPFLFHRTCSCHLGKATDGVHTSIFLARSYGSNGEFPTCGLTPTTGVTSQGLARILAGAVASLLPVSWELAPLETPSGLAEGGHSLTLQLLTPGVACLWPHFQLSEYQTLPLMGTMNHTPPINPAEVIPLKPD
jgi:hypothetical protein